jgi:NADH-quinone oxidoreductase subunit M
MLNHGISTGALFLCVGMMYNRYHTREMDNLSGLGRRMPIWGTFFVFFTFASVGLPGLNGFVGEFLTIFGTFTSGSLLGPTYAGVATLGLITGAIYLLYMIGRVVFGPLKEPAEFAAAIADHGHGHDHGHAEDHAHRVSDLSFREIAALAPLALACLVIGFYPAPILKSFEPAIHKITGPAQAYLPHTEPTPTATAGLAIEQGPRLAVKPAATEVAR